MRRALLLVLGCFELTAAGLLVFLGGQLPSTDGVEKGFARAEGLTGESVKQIGYLRDQLNNVNNPQFGGLREAGDGLGSLADGMEAWAKALDPEMITHLRAGTRNLAGYLNDQVGPAATRAAANMETLSKTLREDALVLSELLKEAPPDLKAAREIHESLSRFGEGLDKMSFLISAERLKTMREGFQGMEQSLDTGAGQVEKLSGYTYPVVKFNGLKPEVDEKSFWPEGEKIAEGMRKGAKAMREANKEFEAQAANLPLVQKSLDDSKKTVKTLRDMLGNAVKNQDKLDPVLKSLPEKTAQLAKALPMLLADFQKVLKETEKLKEISKGLQQAEGLLASAERSWPGARDGLLKSAGQLRELKVKIDDGLKNPGARLQRQEEGLEKLRGSLEEVKEAIPGTSRTVAGIVTAVRWLFWVIAGLLVLHGASIMVGSRAPKSATV